MAVAKKQDVGFALWLLTLFACGAVLTISAPALALDENQEVSEVRTSGEGLAMRVAPGEFLPIVVKLVNFGRAKRTDVTIRYAILDGQEREIYSESETVAVETTASFVKHIQIPRDTQPGNYVALSSLLYEFQEVPATSRFDFTVERKIAGVFQSDLIRYGTLTLAIAVALAVITHFALKQYARSRFTAFDYSDRPREQRIYYEIISDTIAQMRLRVGDDALEIAKNVPDLAIDPESGKVLEIKSDPAKIIALLVLRYETFLGRRVSFALRSKDVESEEKLKPVEENLHVVRKYFE